jgi:hypothetical protein
VTSPHGSEGPDGANESAEDRAWRQIVAHYGDRPTFPEPRATQFDDRYDDQPSPPEEPPEPADDADVLEDLDAFEPPEPPPLPRPEGLRLLAWLGIFVAPAVLLVLTIAGARLAPWVLLGLVCWFLGGFGYLVAKMPHDRDDGWDDGAVL